MLPFKERFAQWQHDTLQTLPDLNNLDWKNETDFLAHTWFNGKQAPRLSLINVVSQQEVFGCEINFFPGCCGALLLNHINSIYVASITASLIKLVMTYHQERAHFYIESTRYRPNFNRQINILNAIAMCGIKITTFGNSYHQNVPLNLWLLSTNIPKIMSPISGV